MKQLYLDAAATTPVYKESVDEMEKYLVEQFGNPSSTHEMGEKASRALKKSREIIAKEINAQPQEIIFTSGGTESNNLAIQGLSRAEPNKKTILISAIEHHSVSEICKYLQTQDYKIIKIPVSQEGIIDFNFLKNQIEKESKDILLVSIMHVNNIIGTIQDIEKIGKLCNEKNILFHSDAVQSFCKLKIDLKKMNIDLLSASGHKIGAPKGIGFLYVKEGVKIQPLIFGGGQEKNLRSGTENVPAIAALAKAVELSKKIDKAKIKKTRDSLIKKLENLGGKLNGSRENRIYNNLHFSFDNLDAENLIEFLSINKIYASIGSACETKKEDHILNEIGLKNIKNSLRISLYRTLTEKEENYIVKKIQLAMKKLKV